MDNILAGSPAEAAGLLPGDYLLKVGAVDVAGATLDRVGQAIREAGSHVELTVECSALHHMLQGTELVKARQQPVRRVFRLTPDLARIHWPSKHRSADNAVYRIGDIKEIMWVACVCWCDVMCLQPWPQDGVVCADGCCSQERIVPAAAGKRGAVLLAGDWRGDAAFGLCVVLTAGQDFDPVDFVAPTKLAFNIWTVGLAVCRGIACALPTRMLSELVRQGGASGTRTRHGSRIITVWSKPK